MVLIDLLLELFGLGPENPTQTEDDKRAANDLGG